MTLFNIVPTQLQQSYHFKSCWRVIFGVVPKNSSIWTSEDTNLISFYYSIYSHNLCYKCRNFNSLITHSSKTDLGYPSHTLVHDYWSKANSFLAKGSTLYHNINNYQTKKLRTHPMPWMLNSNWIQIQAHQIQKLELKPNYMYAYTHLTISIYSTSANSSINSLQILCSATN